MSIHRRCTCSHHDHVGGFHAGCGRMSHKKMNHNTRMIDRRQYVHVCRGGSLRRNQRRKIHKICTFSTCFRGRLKIFLIHSFADVRDNKRQPLRQNSCHHIPRFLPPLCNPSIPGRSYPHQSDQLRCNRSTHHKFCCPRLVPSRCNRWILSRLSRFQTGQPR